MKKTILFSVLALLTILFFQKIQNSLLQFNFSWTISFLFPYIVLGLLGLALALTLKRRLKRVPFVVRALALLLIFALPFTLGFALNPMYEGDLTTEGKTITSGNKSEDFKSVDLVIITIPGCPFCKMSVGRMNLLKKRNPGLRIKYLVCSSILKDIQELKPGLNPGIAVALAKDAKQMFDLSGGKFPCFVKIKKNKAIHKWTNNQLGAGALDWIESGDF